MDALQLLKKDHRAIQTLFKRFESHGERGARAKRGTVDQIIHDLSVHSAIEEAVFYPAIRRKAHEGKNQKADHDVLEALEEHHIAKWSLAEIQKLQPSDERFDAKMTVMMESVRHHIHEEETEIFRQVHRLFDANELAELGRALEAAKRLAPTRPHPRAPDQPPMKIVSDIVSAVVDRSRDMVRDTLRGTTGGTRRARARKRNGGRARA